MINEEQPTCQEAGEVVDLTIDNSDSSSEDSDVVFVGVEVPAVVLCYAELCCVVLGRDEILMQSAMSLARNVDVESMTCGWSDKTLILFLFLFSFLPFFSFRFLSFSCFLALVIDTLICNPVHLL